jgi:hypothetical protein
MIRAPMFIGIYMSMDTPVAPDSHPFSRRGGVLERPLALRRFRLVPTGASSRVAMIPPIGRRVKGFLRQGATTPRWRCGSIYLACLPIRARATIKARDETRVVQGGGRC